MEAASSPCTAGPDPGEAQPGQGGGPSSICSHSPKRLQDPVLGSAQQNTPVYSRQTHHLGALQEAGRGQGPQRGRWAARKGAQGWPEHAWAPPPGQRLCPGYTGLDITPA